MSLPSEQLSVSDTHSLGSDENLPPQEYLSMLGFNLGEIIYQFFLVHISFLMWYYLGFSYFEFKIRLIRLGLYSQKQKFLCSNSQPTDS